MVFLKSNYFLVKVMNPTITITTFCGDCKCTNTTPRFVRTECFYTNPFFNRKSVYVQDYYYKFEYSMCHQCDKTPGISDRFQEHSYELFLALEQTHQV